MTRWIAYPALAAALAVMVATPRASRGEQGGEVGAEVGMTNALDYEPATVTIRAGQTVLWRNTSDLVHTVTADDELATDDDHVRLPEGAEPFGSGRMEPGATYRRTFAVPGRYTYFCIPHEASGMIGHIVVEPRV